MPSEVVRTSVPAAATYPEKSECMSVSLSVVICTHNRVDSLRRCTSALASVKTNCEWEIIIVDNMSNDGTSVFLGSLPKKLGTAAVLSTFEQKRGLGAARNKGRSVARGKIVAFIDDDCYVSEDYIDAMISAFDNNPRVGFVGGRLLLYDQSDLRMTIQESEDYRIFPSRTFIAPGIIQGANMAFRRETLESIGGFDENFGTGTRFGCEDIDALAHALWSGISGAYDPRPTVYHHHGRKTRADEIKLKRKYDIGRGAYYAKFILRRDSRWQYLANWLRSIIRDFCLSIGDILRGRRPRIKRSLYEISGAFHYIAIKGKHPLA